MERPGAVTFARGALLWAAFTVPALTADRIGLNEPRPGWQQAAGVVVLAVAVAVSRRLPLVAFGLVAALSLAAAPAMFTVSYGPALSGCALLLGLRAGRARPAVLCFTAVGCAGTVRIALVGVDPTPEWLVMTGTLLFGCVFPWLGGRYWQQSRELAEAGWLRAARLEDDARFAEERARLRERARIAQDMHDSLGHELSLIALRAGALQVAPGLAGEHRAAAADLRTAAADATDRLHRIIGVLREDDDEPVPLTPAGETLEQLVTRAAESGLPVRWDPAGHDPAADSDEVAERLLHRVAREALTNAARHAPGAPVAVAVTGHAEGTSVTVTSGRATQDVSPPSGGGTGLPGLRAAVTSVGGEFEAGPQGEGFRVRAFVPRQRTTVMPARPGRAPFTHARRRVAVGLVSAAGVGAVLVGAAFGWYAWTEKRSVLEPAVYAALRRGAPAAEVERVLPERDVRDPPAERAPAPEPDGADCRYYRASGELFVSVDHFRLCFDAGRLVAKDVVPRAGLSREGGKDDEEFSR
ncbi:signal transduction histidine kinase [Streptomyces luteogriseus]|uniref:sensor histidine kinase n=1 Tax=Streptomyces luteogriseus TaxID=68233 RepID=UPI00278B9381|nr:sensor histidine kinase [Streptomyces luteogriseus]MDQ0715252.1 signal transduction histidine kinase [Streptomyces luteogriseus]